MRRPIKIIRAAVLSTTVSIWAMAAGAPEQYRLQHATSIDLSLDFLAGGASGANPLSIAFDGTNAYVAGYNNSGADASVGIVKVSNVLTAGPSVAALANSQFTASSQRGIVGLDFDATSGALYAAYDSGAAGTSTIARRNTTDGAADWTITSPQGVRPFALSIDPRGDSGTPGVAFVTPGSGRRRLLKTSDGSTVFDGTNGGIINMAPAPTQGGLTSWRGIDIDAAGNLAATTAGAIGYGVRNTDNQWMTTAGSLNNTGKAIDKNVSIDNVGQAVAIVDGLGIGTSVLAVSGRSVTQFTDSLGGTTGVAATNLHLRNIDGTTAGLSQIELTGGEDGVGAAWTGELKGTAFGTDAQGNPVLLVLSFAERRLDVYNLEPTWNVAGGGSWTTNANWLASKIPNTSLDNAVFGSVISSAATVALDGPKTVKNIKFDNASSYTIDGTDAITLDSAGTTSIRVLSGAHTITAPVVALKDVTLEAAGAGDSLELTDSLNATGVNVVKTGAGTVSAGAVRAALLDVQSGAMKITAKGTPNSTSGTSVVGSLTIAGGPATPSASLDLSNNSMIIDVTGGIGSLVDDTRQLLLAGSTGSLGIVSSSADATRRLGFGDNGVLGKTSFAGETVDADALLIKFTYAGDSNLDGQVDITDLAALATAWQTNGPWTSGDFNYDGFVDITDLAALATNWQAGVGAPLAQSFEQALASVGLPSAAVPEPAALGALAGILAWSRRRRAR